MTEEDKLESKLNETSLNATDESSSAVTGKGPDGKFASLYSVKKLKNFGFEERKIHDKLIFTLYEIASLLLFHYLGHLH